MGLYKLLGLESINNGFKKIGDIVDKSIEDKDKKNELNAELIKLETETEVKIHTLINGRMGTMLERCISLVFPMIGALFSLYLLSNLVMYWIIFFTGKQHTYLYVDEKMYQIIGIYLAGFFGSSAVGKFVNKNSTGGK